MDGYRGNIIMIEYFNGILRNIITEYGRLAVEDIKESVQNFIGCQTNQYQNLVQLFHCLANSMTESAQLNTLEESSYYMDGETSVGELLFKLMVNTAIIDTHATATCLQ